MREGEGEGEDEHEEHKREDEENIDTIIPDMIPACHWHPPGVMMMRPADLHYNLSAQETETPSTDS